jgi:GNAT superfamily N-acetyltransferase
MTALPAFEITRHDDLPAEAAAIVDAGLGEFNDAAAPMHESKPLSCFARVVGARAGDDDVLGGAVGRTWGECCELQQLWVHAAHRRQGLGARLVQTFHEQAQARGCVTFYLETFSFQAPSLYRALGYQVRLEIAGFSPGVRKLFMVREAAR